MDMSLIKFNPRGKKYKLFTATGKGNYEPTHNQRGRLIIGSYTKVEKARKAMEKKFPNKFFRTFLLQRKMDFR